MDIKQAKEQVEYHCQLAEKRGDQGKLRDAIQTLLNAGAEPMQQESPNEVMQSHVALEVATLDAAVATMRNMKDSKLLTAKPDFARKLFEAACGYLERVFAPPFAGDTKVPNVNPDSLR